MPNEACILTTKDFTIMEVMRDRCLGMDDPLAPILARKIKSAVVVFREDVPANVATVSSRVTFRVDSRDPDTRILSHHRVSSPVGMFLPITNPRALALLGLSEGQEFVLTDAEGREETVLLEKVQYQPEAAGREREAMARLSEPSSRKPALRLIRGALDSEPGRVAVAEITSPDDPGPSAA